MMLANAGLVVECVVAVLLVVLIAFVAKLDRRLAGIRRREQEMQQLMTEFNVAAERAEASAGKLKTVGIEAEKGLRAGIERGQSLRDDLAFMIDRGAAVADQSIGSFDGCDTNVFARFRRNATTVCSRRAVRRAWRSPTAITGRARASPSHPIGRSRIVNI